MRMSLAQLRQASDEDHPPPQIQASPIEEPSGIIFYVTAHVTTTNNGVLDNNSQVYAVTLGPSRSRTTAFQALRRNFPRTHAVLHDISTMEWESNNHSRWTEPNGDKILVRMQQEENPAICATGPDAELFLVTHRVTNFDQAPVTEDTEIAGTFLTNGQAAAAALRLLRSDIEGHAVDGPAEEIKEDGTVLYNSLPVAAIQCGDTNCIGTHDCSYLTIIETKEGTLEGWFKDKKEKKKGNWGEAVGAEGTGEDTLSSTHTSRNEFFRRIHICYFRIG
jgi:hypothetical protein